MRTNEFLRTPLRADHQAGLANLTVGEQPHPEFPALTDPYPQTLLITFDKPAPAHEVEIVPLWEGELVFLADTKTGLPQSAAQVTRTAASGWPLTGDLVLHTSQGLEAAFTAHLPLIKPLPVNVRYSKIKLTADFLFDTLARLNFSFIQGGKVKSLSGQQNLKEAIIGFLQGHTRAVIALGQNPAQDPALYKMPVVAEGDGSTMTLAVTLSSLGPEASDPHWFDEVPEYDTVSGETLVPPSLANDAARLFNPHHPAHSVISALGLYQLAAPGAFAPDHPVATPLRGLLTAALPDGKVFRKIIVDRPPLPGAPVSAYPRRQFPLFKFVSNLQGGELESIRLPLSGRLYLPLADGDYFFSAIPRSQDAQNGTAGDLVRLTSDQDATGYHCLGNPLLVFITSLAASQNTLSLYAHLRDFDSKRAWRVFAQLNAAQVQKSFDIGKYWQVGPLMPDSERVKFRAMNWYIPTANPVDADYSALYGLFREAAGRHHLAPEMLQATFMGEVIGTQYGLIFHNIQGIPAVRYNPQQNIWDSFQELGLDDLFRESTLFLSPPWVLDHYLGALTELPSHQLETRTLNGQPVTDHGIPAAITGWEAAIEWMAGALQWRLDLAQQYCANHNIRITTETQRRYLTYVHFNTGQTWPVHGQDFAEPSVQAINQRLKPWDQPRPPSNTNARFNTLLRIATAEWFESLGLYR